MAGIPPETEPELPESIGATMDLPFDGLFGDTAELRVLQEVVADPYSDYTQLELMELTGLSDPSVRKGIRALVRQGIVKDISKARRHPIYRAQPGSKKLVALTFLAYASLDDKAGSRSMEDAVRDYCGSIALSPAALTMTDEGTFVRYPHPGPANAGSGEGSFRVIVEEA